MSETSSRVLVDRAVIRLDGRPFFAFGPRVLLTPPSRYAQVLQEIAQLGFTAVASPPLSEGTIPMMELFFDAAERAGLMVLLMADPRVHDQGRFIARAFRGRGSLLAYQLPSPASANMVPHYLSERDAIRALDLFHPIYSPLREDCWDPRWFSAQDVYAPVVPVPVTPTGRLLSQSPGSTLRHMQRLAVNAPLRPVMCTDLLAQVQDEARMAGLYDDDPAVASHSRKSLEWFPYYSSFAHSSRRDLLGPFPEMLRLQVYDLLMSGARGVFLDFFEGMQGSEPGTGRDRLCEAGILAHEIAILKDFLSEGRLADVEVDSGHPRLDCVAIQHGHETLLLMRMNGYEDEYFVDEAFLERTEVSVLWRQGGPINAWRLDLPAPRRIEMIRDQSGSIRLLAGEVELTAVILLTPGQQRVDELASLMGRHLEQVARLAVEAAAVSYSKTLWVETELMALGVGMDNRERLKAAESKLVEARSAIEAGAWADGLAHGRLVSRHLRRLVKYQMAKALAMQLVDRTGIRPRLRNSYYTLPRFYRENQIETARAFSDIT